MPDALSVCFQDIRSGDLIKCSAIKGGGSVQILINTEDIEMAGDIV